MFDLNDGRSRLSEPPRASLAGSGGGEKERKCDVVVVGKFALRAFGSEKRKVECSHNMAKACHMTIGDKDDEITVVDNYNFDEQSL